ncbi:MAG: glucokinase [Rhizomicrobium sp.]|jgi:glucokinase
MSDERILVGDIGGTHARFAVARSSGGRWTIDYRSDIETEAANFEDVLHGYLDKLGAADRPGAAAIAVAGPVTDGKVTFTNRNWQLSEVEFTRQGFQRALLINDFAALAFAAARAQPHELFTLGPDIQGLPDQPISILGAGTGFGVSCLARYRGRSVPIATEGGHIGFAPANEKEIAVLRNLTGRFGRVSVERILSGPGIENVYGALHQIAGSKSESLEASAIVERAGAGDSVAADAVALFCAVYGAVAGDIALAHGARGGVFIAGGIAQKIRDVLAASEFRARFEGKGRLSPFVHAIPTRIVLDNNATFIGAAIASLEIEHAK